MILIQLNKIKKAHAGRVCESKMNVQDKTALSLSYYYVRAMAYVELNLLKLMYHHLF